MSYNIVVTDTIRHIILFVNIYYNFYKKDFMSRYAKTCRNHGQVFLSVLLSVSCFMFWCDSLKLDLLFLNHFYHKRFLRTDRRAFPACDTLLIVYDGRFKIFLAQCADRTGFHRRTFMILRTVLFSDFQLSFHNDSSFPCSK